jgi:hypothetical protein
MYSNCGLATRWDGSRTSVKLWRRSVTASERMNAARFKKCQYQYMITPQLSHWIKPRGNKKARPHGFASCWSCLQRCCAVNQPRALKRPGLTIGFYPICTGLAGYSPIAMNYTGKGFLCQKFPPARVRLIVTCSLPRGKVSLAAPFADAPLTRSTVRVSSLT